MGLLAVLGLILIVVGFLGLLKILALGLVLAIILVVAGVLCLVFGRSAYIR